MTMEYRRLGRTELQVSTIGVGTNELRLLTSAQAIDMLLRSFDLGVNIVHTSPDYEGAEQIVADAVARTDRRVIVASQGYDVHYNTDGRVDHFERLFEETCRRLETERLDLYGIAAVDDREAFRENVWGRHGMVEFLQRMKREGRLGSVYCTNHGEPAHMRKLIASGVFDALMISCNPLGYHLLTLHPPVGRHFEDVVANCAEIVPLCREHDIGVMAMMPLAGGLLVDSRAFPPRRLEPAGCGNLSAADVLRAILEDRDIACVLPGAGSIVEAEENAWAGYAPIVLEQEARDALRERVASLRTSLCSRCGACEALCSHQLPISWLFRAAEMAQQPAEAFETWSDVEYFRLHPRLEATCATCDDVSCACPSGIAIPQALVDAHDHALRLMNAGLMMPPVAEALAYRGDGDFAARIIVEDIPDAMPCGLTRVCRLHLENIGSRGWFPQGEWENGGVLLRAYIDGNRHAEAWLRQAVHMGGRGHLLFELTAPRQPGPFHLKLKLLAEYEGYADESGFDLFSRPIDATDSASQPLDARLNSWLHLQGDRRLDDPLDRGRTPMVEPRLPAYGVCWLEHNLPRSWRSGDLFHVYLRVMNRGGRRWAAHHPDGNIVNLVVRSGGIVVLMPALPHDVLPGAEVVIDFPFALPAGVDDWDLSFSFVEQNIAWFEQDGGVPLAVRVERLPDEPSVNDQAAAVLLKHNPSHYSPSHGVPRSRSGKAYPSVIAEASGAIIRDSAGNRWIDFVMGWGSALLGYAHPSISGAVASCLGCGAILALPHRLEAEVTELLVKMIPSAETVLFGKNGSDACTAAIRAARVTTGREIVLFSGYHGWQDPFGSVFEASHSPNGKHQAFRFGLGDIDGLRTLADCHRGRVAAVMIEPAAQVEGVEGPVRACDPVFLQAVADLARQQGAVLIFEIMTGFRYAKGSVQQATGVVPDLTCLGKALTSGMPLSALVGRRDILQPALAKLFYHPTFKGEVYSFAAAKAALELYRDLDVPSRIDDYGTRLMRHIDATSADLGIDGGMVGLPFRMVYRFNEANDLRRAQMRTLLQQSLLQQGIMTFRGFMLPSLAHGEAEMDHTVAAFRKGLIEVRDAVAADRIVCKLELPLLY